MKVVCSCSAHIILRPLRYIVGVIMNGKSFPLEPTVHSPQVISYLAVAAVLKSIYSTRALRSPYHTSIK